MLRLEVYFASVDTIINIKMTLECSAHEYN